MSARNSVRIVGSALLLSLSCAMAACTANRHGSDQPEFRGAIDRLSELQPVDIAVAPVRDQTDAQRVPLDLFRGAFVETLIERRYSPLAPAYVDANWVEASFRGTPPPDALLVVAVTGWDPSHLHSTGKVSAGADVVLYEGGDTTGTVLWQRSFEETVDLGDGRGHPPPNAADLVPRAVRLLTQRALKDLPMRDPVAAHGTTPQK